MSKTKKRRAAREKLARERVNKVPEGCELSQAVWDSVSEQLRQGIHERFIELQEGFDKWRSIAETVEAVKPFDEMAKASGTTLVEALQRYTAAEQEFRANPVAATLRLWSGMGVDPLTAIAALRRRLGSGAAHAEA